jgi:hypothetical protein
MPEAALIQRAYTAILRHSMDNGVAPHYTTLAKLLGVTPDEARELQSEAARASVGCWLSPDTDYIHSFAPFSNLPTQYIVTVGGKQKYYGQ